MEKLSIAVAIPTYLREAELVQTIAQVLDQNPPADEVLVIDQTPKHLPSTSAALKAWDDQGKIHWIKMNNPNLPSARNQALIKSVCDIMLFLDDDVLLADKNLVEKHRNLHTVNDIDAVCGQVLSRYGRAIDITNTEAIRQGWSVTAAANIHTTGIPMLRGGHHSIRINIAKSVGGYDESLLGSAFAEDLDMAQRLDCNRILTTSYCSLIHLAAPSGGCRVMGKTNPTPEWSKTVSAFVNIFRHSSRLPGFFSTWLKCALRAGPLRKEVVLKPWKWPWAWLNLFYAIFEGYKRAKSGIKSPFL